MSTYIQKRYRRYYAILEIPADLRERLGKPRFVKSLQTESESIARRRALPLIAVWKRLIERARGSSPLIAEAQRWRQSIADEIARADFDEEIGPITPLLLSDRVEEIEKHKGAAAARLFMEVAQGEALMIEDMSDAWLAEAGYPAKTAYQHQRTIAMLLAHYKTVGEIDRKTAGAFVTNVLAKGVTHRSGSPRKAETVNRLLSTYIRLWAWLERRGHVSSNPWQRQSLPKAKRNGDTGNGNDEDRRRPFTDDEARALLGSLEGVDRDVSMVAAVTGMRLEEIAVLRPEDATVKGTGKAQVIWLSIHTGKAPAARRTVPVVDASVRAMLADRKASGKDRLFHELEADRFGDYGTRVSKRVGRKLRAIGLTDPRLAPEHSYRHRARTLMERADVAPWTADWLLGHKRHGEGLGRYSQGPSEEQRIEAVKAISLPTV